jgi:hypothetical protein
VRQHGCDIGVADGQFFRNDAAGQIVGADAALLLRQREGAQPDLRGLVQRL